MASLLKQTSLQHVLFIVMCNSYALSYSLQEWGSRAKRQDGYVYDKPRISFNLPTRPSSTVSTQAPTVNRPQEQQMYYAYPAPAGGDIVNIGYSTAGSTSTTSVTSSGVAATASSGGGGYNYGSQSTAISTSGGTNSGYNYNSPTVTAGTTPGTVSQTVPSTNAPKYLPPISGGGGGAGGGVSVNIPSSGATTVPSVTNTGVSVPNTDYLPPIPNQQPSPGLPSPTPSPSPAPGPSPSPTPTTGYLPPSGSPTTAVPTPAATYLPPVL